jgi:uncharacterized membrane protein YoaK (UPF0700 family)
MNFIFAAVVVLFVAACAQTGALPMFSPAEAQALAVLYVSAIAGMFTHFAKKLLQDELPHTFPDGGIRKWTCHLYRYLFVDYPRRTVTAVIGVVGSCMAVQAIGQMHAQPIYMVIGIGWGCGYISDSLGNRT